MRIVVLDGFTTNPGDLSWDALYKIGECQIYERTPRELVLDRVKSADIVLTNKTILDRDMLYAMDKCKYIGVMATGYNVVNLEAASEKEIIVTNVPAYSTKSVAQMVFAHILNLTQHVAAHSESVTFGKWSSNKDFCYWDYPLIELADRTIGIVGLGRIGKQVAKIANAMDMHILAYTKPTEKDVPDYITITNKLDDVFIKSDFVTLHCPLTKDTENIVNADRLRMMRSTSFLINTSRGPLIDEIALTVALNKGWLAGAGLDVLSEEPPRPENPLFSAPNCYITPHISWATRSARKRLLDTVINNIQSYIKGNVQNQVN